METITHCVSPEDQELTFAGEGTTLRAICGATWEASRSLVRAPLCGKCKEILRAQGVINIVDYDSDGNPI